MKLRDAQIAYDNQEPPEQWDCERDGHQWNHSLRNDRYCLKCGAKEVEVEED